MNSSRDSSSDDTQSVQVPCPKCSTKLKLRDRKLLGKRGKCPKCEHRFVLEDPDEIVLEIADETILNDTFDFDSNEKTESKQPAENELPDFAALAQNSPQSSAAPIASTVIKPRKRKAGALQFWLILVVVAAAGGGSLYYFSQPGDTPATSTENTTNAQSKTTDVEPEKPKNLATEKEFQAFVRSYQPTEKADNVSLKWVPHGARIVIHLHPKTIWSNAETMAKLRSSWKPFFEWAAAKIEQVCLYPPEQIEQATICLILAQRGVAPDVAAVVSTAEPIDKTALSEKLKGQLLQQGSAHDVYANNEHAAILIGENKLSIVPRSMLDEVIELDGTEAISDPAIEDVLKVSDSGRHFSIAFLLADLPIHKQYLFPEHIVPRADEWIETYGQGVETALWSLHVDQPSVSEIYLRNQTVHENKPYSSKILNGELPSRFALGKRTAIGELSAKPYSADSVKQYVRKFPAMVEQLPPATVTGDKPNRLTQIKTVMPHPMLTNLVMGARLLNLPEGTSSKSEATSITKQPETAPQKVSLDDRLKTEIEIDFRRTPLQEAIDYIAAESGIKITIDGDGLKLAGYTKNMPQTMKLGKVSAKAALSEVLKQYDKMVVARIDENSDELMVTTKAKTEGNEASIVLP